MARVSPAVCCGLGSWEREQDVGATLRAVARSRMAAVGERNGLDERQSEAAARLVGASVLAASESLEGAWEQPIGKSVALVGHVQLDVPELCSWRSA